MWAAVRLMVLADATMSLDNVLAVAAIAESTAHPAPVLILGLALSIPIVLLGGGLIATLLERFSWLAWLGAAVLTITAASLITNDKGLRGHLGSSRSSDVAVAAGLSALVLGAAWRETRRVGVNLAAAGEIQPMTVITETTRPRPRRQSGRSTTEKRRAVYVPAPDGLAGMRGGVGSSLSGNSQVKAAVTGFVHSSMRVTAPASSKTSLIR